MTKIHKQFSDEFRSLVRRGNDLPFSKSGSRCSNVADIFLKRGMPILIASWRDSLSNEDTPGGLRCWDTEDVEGWLVDEGIGYFDGSGRFHYGNPPISDYDLDDAPSAFEDIPDAGKGTLDAKCKSILGLDPKKKQRHSAACASP